MASHGHIYNDPRCDCPHCLKRNAQLLADIQRNIDVQKANPFDSPESKAAREANERLFREAKRLRLAGTVG